MFPPPQCFKGWFEKGNSVTRPGVALSIRDLAELEREFHNLLARLAHAGKIQPMSLEVPHMTAPPADANTASPNSRRKTTPHANVARPAAKPVLERMSPELRRAVMALRGLKGVL